MASQQLKLNLISKPPMFAIDGHIINITDQNVADVIFFQVAKKDGDNSIDANGIASVRMTVDQLKSLSGAITNTIKQHEENIKKKK